MIVGDRIRLPQSIPPAHYRVMDFDLPLSRRESLRARRRRPSTVTVPERVSPHVKLVFTEMQRQRVTYDELSERSGVRRAAMKAWRHKNKPSLDSIEAVLGALGWDFVPVPRASVLPKELAADAATLAAKHGVTVEKTLEVLVALVARIHERADAPATAPSIEDMELT